MMDRKQFIQQAGRSVILLAMAGLVALFASKQKITSSRECGISAQCRNCGKLNRCALPEANKFRNNG